MKTTKEFKKAIKEFENKGFYINVYETENENVRRYKNELIEQLNKYNLDLRYEIIQGYTFEDIKKNVEEYFKDAKDKRIKQLINSFVSIDRQFFNSDKIGYSDNLKVSFEDFKKVVEEFINTKKAYTIQKGLYGSEYSRENEINNIKKDFKQFIELALNLSYKETDFKINVFNHHIKIVLTNDKLKGVYTELLKNHILGFYKKAVYFNVVDLKQVLKDSGENRFILVTDLDKNKQIVYVYLDVLSYAKIKIKPIETPLNYDINADINKYDFKRFDDVSNLIGYATRNDKPLNKETITILTDIYNMFKRVA